MASDSIKLDGWAALDKALKEFPAKVENKMMRAALRAGGNVFRRRAREKLVANGSRRSGKLYRSVRVSTKKNKRGQMQVTIYAGNKAAFYANWVEFGTKAHLISAIPAGGGKNQAASLNRKAAKRGEGAQALSFAGTTVDAVRHPGGRAKPFMRPAFDGGYKEALDAVATHLRSRIAKERMKR